MPAVFLSFWNTLDTSNMLNTEVKMQYWASLLSLTVLYPQPRRDKQILRCYSDLCLKSPPQFHIFRGRAFGRWLGANLISGLLYWWVHSWMCCWEVGYGWGRPFGAWSVGYISASISFSVILFLLPTCHGMNSYLPPGSSTALFLPWSLPNLD